MYRIEAGSPQYWYRSMQVNAGAATWLTDPDQRHIDVRSWFEPVIAPRTFAELNLATQAELEDNNGEYDIMRQMETHQVYPWSTITSAITSEGITFVDDTHMPSGWRGLCGWVTDSTFTASIVSSVSTVAGDRYRGAALDLSSMDDLLIPVPTFDCSLFDGSESIVTLTSRPDGGFDGLSYESTQVGFVSNTSGNAHVIRLPLSEFTAADPGDQFDLASVTGVKIDLKSTSATAGQRVTLLAVRAVDADWDHHHVGIDTHRQALTLPPTEDGSSSSSPVFPLLRGNDGGDDPLPLDTALTAVFNTGRVHEAKLDLTQAAYDSRWLDASGLVGASALPFPSNLTGATQLVSTSTGWQGGVDNAYDIRLAPHGDGSKLGHTGYSKVTVGGSVGARGTASLPAYLGVIHIPGQADSDTIGKARDSMAAFVQDTGSQWSLRARWELDGEVHEVSNSIAPLNPTLTYFITSQLDGWNLTATLFDADPELGGAQIATLSVNWLTHILSTNTRADAAAMMRHDVRPGIMWRSKSDDARLTSFTYRRQPVDTQSSISLFFRQQDESTYGTYARATLQWNGAGYSVDFSTFNQPSSPSPTSTVTESISIPLKTASLSDLADGRHAFRATVNGSSVTLSLHEVSASDARLGSAIYSRTITSAPEASLLLNTGRVGYQADFSGSPDAYLSDFYASPSSFGYLRSTVHRRRQPIDGVQVFADASESENLFRSLSWIDPNDEYVDTTKSSSGRGSYRTRTGVFTNMFTVGDWRTLSVNLSIWAGPEIDLSNQPVLMFTSSDGTVTYPLPQLRPNAWNDVEVDLSSITGDMDAGLMYYMAIRPPSSINDAGYYWVDADIRVNRKQIEWQVRATEHGPFRSVGSTINDPKGAVHFPRDERGSYLQVQAIALSPDVWIDNYRLIPRNARLGNFVSDMAYERGE